MNQKQEIILRFFREGKSQRAISRETGIDRKTVSKYIRAYEESRQKLLKSAESDPIEKADLISEIVEKPVYNTANRQKRKLTSEIEEKIRAFLEENERKQQRGQSKQQKKRVDIYEILKKEGYDIGYTTVRMTVNRLLQKGNEAFIRQEYDPGDVCEFDWGEVKLYIDGELITLQMAVFTAAYSNYRYALLFSDQKTQSFIESHALFFEHIGGVYRTMVYDNMRVVIRKFVGRSEKEPTEALLKLSMYYGFSFRFCNIRSGNEKGHVERSVEVVRRKAFCDKDQFSSIAEANEYLLEFCQTLNQQVKKENNQSAVERFNEERSGLHEAMPRYETARTKLSTVDKYSTITIDTCHYSVPDQYVGQTVFTKIYATQILCYVNGKKVAEHVRSLNPHQWLIQLGHYYHTLQKKPGALVGSTAFKQADTRIKKIYENYFIKKEKAFIELLLFCQEESNLDEIEMAIERLAKLTPSDVTVEKIKFLCQPIMGPLPVETNKMAEILVRSKEHLEHYGRLLSEAPEAVETGWSA